MAVVNRPPSACTGLCSSMHVTQKSAVIRLYTSLLCPIDRSLVLPAVSAFIASHQVSHDLALRNSFFPSMLLSLELHAVTRIACRIQSAFSSTRSFALFRNIGLLYQEGQMFYSTLYFLLGFGDAVLHRSQVPFCAGPVMTACLSRALVTCRAWHPTHLNSD